LVNRVVAPERLLDEALDMAEMIAAHDMLAIWLTKRTLNASANMTLGDAIAMENTAQVIAMDSEAARKKTASFLNRKTN
jgi:enoyl-CoA hydratase/carnithine racemase